MIKNKLANKTRKQTGQGLVEYALILGLVTLVVGGVLIILGPTLGDVYSQLQSDLAGEPESPGYVVVSVVDEAGKGIPNVRVYAFNESRRYLRKYGNTDANGDLAFEDLEDGTYLFRAGYQREQFWSASLTWPQQWHATIETQQRPFTVKVIDQAQEGISGVRVYAFDENGRYLGQYGRSDENGEVELNLVDGSFQFRADYRGYKYWSAIVDHAATDNTVVMTGERPLTVHVVNNSQQGIENVRAYIFNENDRYIGIYGNTTADGSLQVNLPDGNFKVRVDYRRQRYWSDLVNSPALSSVIVMTGERPFTIKATNANGDPLQNVRIYAFDENDRYVGLYGNTDSSGNLTLVLPDGNYKFRANYRGQTYWSDVYTSPDSNSATIETGETTFTVNVVANGGAGINNVRVYVFNDRNQYTGIYGDTNASGIVELEIPSGQFKFRADYRGYKYWSNEMAVPDAGSATVMTGERPFTVTVQDSNGQALNNIRVYAFNERGGYTGVYGNTDSNGVVTLQIPNGSFKFRADYNRTRYWSDLISTPLNLTTTITTD